MSTNNKTNKPQAPAQRPPKEPSTAGKIIAALIVTLIGLAGLRSWRSTCLEDAARQPGYEWRYELELANQE